MIDEANNDVFAYARTFGKEQVVVVANFRKEAVSWKVPEDLELQPERVLTTNYGDVGLKGEVVELRPFEAFACYVK